MRKFRRARESLIQREHCLVKSMLLSVTPLQINNNLFTYKCKYSLREMHE